MTLGEKTESGLLRSFTIFEHVLGTAARSRSAEGLKFRISID